MIAPIKKFIKWASRKTPEDRQNQTSFLMAAFIAILEDILFWKRMWLSLSFILVLNLFFLLLIHQQVSFLGFVCSFFATVVSADAVETWLKYKHRENFLKSLASHKGIKLHTAVLQLKSWIKIQCNSLVFLRETNHTKSFLLVNITLSTVFLIGKYVNGYLLTYLICMILCFSNKLVPPIQRMAKNIQQTTDSDGELEGLLPDVSDVDIKLLSIEPEHNQIADEKQSLDYWKPEDLPIEEEASDSSDNSSSLVTNLSIEKMHKFDKEVETSESSEDEYIPLVQHKDQLRSTFEVQPTDTWGTSAFNTLRNITGAVSGMLYTAQDKNSKVRKRVSSADSSDGFEIIDKSELN